MANVHALKLTGTIAGSGWTDGSNAGAGSSASAVLSGTQLTLSATSVATEAEAVITSNTTYDLRNSVFQINVVSKTGDSNFMAEMDFGSGNLIRFFILQDGTLEAYKAVGGTDTLIYTAAWDSTTYAWLRFRYFIATYYFETSVNGKTWTERATTTTGFSPSAGTATISASAEAVEAGVMVVNHWNVPFSPLCVVAQTIGVGSGAGREGDGDLTIAFPANYTPVADDFVLITLYADQGDGSTPTSYAEVTGSPWGSATPKLLAFTDILAGGESSPVTTISGSAATMSIVAGMSVWWGGIGIGAIGTASAGTGTPMTAAEITTVAATSYVVGLCGRGDNETSGNQSFGGSTTGVVELFDSGTAEGADSQVSVYTKYIASPAATGAGSADTSITDPWVSVLLEIRAEAAAAAGSIPKFSDHYRKMMAA